jgi:antitoxin HigA-1
MNKLKPIHPGEVLQAEFLVPFRISQYRLAKDLDVPARRINEIVQGMRGITADTALRLSRYFATTAQFWMNLQSRYEIEKTRDERGKSIEREVKVCVAVLGPCVGGE